MSKAWGYDAMLTQTGQGKAGDASMCFVQSSVLPCNYLQKDYTYPCVFAWRLQQCQRTLTDVLQVENSRMLDKASACGCRPAEYVSSLLTGTRNLRTPSDAFIE